MGLVSLLIRDYQWQAIAEVRKLLGGAGPAIAAVPASLLWAGISIVELGKDVATKRVGAHAALPRLGFYFFTASGQVRLETRRLAQRLADSVACGSS